MDPQQIVIDYIERVWNRGEIDAVTELCTDPYLRHEAGECLSLTHADQLDRVRGLRSAATAADGRSIRFSNVLVTGSGSDVCALWNMTAPLDCALAAQDLPFEIVGNEIHMCGTEIFRVVDGRITDVWNPPPMAGHWG